jgi:hypothetical protein
MTTFTSEDRISAQEISKALDKLVDSYTMYVGEPIPFGGHADLSKKDEEVWHFSVQDRETKIEIKKTWDF